MINWRDRYFPFIDQVYKPIIRNVIKEWLASVHCSCAWSKYSNNRWKFFFIIWVISPEKVHQKLFILLVHLCYISLIHTNSGILRMLSLRKYFSWTIIEFLSFSLRKKVFVVFLKNKLIFKIVFQMSTLKFWKIRREKLVKELFKWGW